jgi:hypothetical protein
MTMIKFDLYKVFDDLKEINYETLYEYFKNNYKQSLFVKNIDDNLILVHNNIDKNLQNSLEKECRSVIINITNKLQPTIVAYSHDNIDYSSIDEYIQVDDDIIEESYEGTMISVYYTNNKWYFSSTRCPSINDSYFFNKAKSHGMMFDEILSTYYPDSTTVREEFVKNLDINKSYYFIIVHYENKYLIDYTEKFGAQYKKLVHIITRDKVTQIELGDILPLPVVYPTKYSNINTDVGLESEGFIIKRKDLENNKTVLIKIPTKEYIKRRLEKPNYNNPLISAIDIFQRNNHNYKPNDFINKYYPDVKLINMGVTYDITGVIYLIIKNLALEINIIYNYFTHFDITEKKYVKRNTTLYQNLLMKNNYKTLRNCINRLQNYQVNHIKHVLILQDFLDHLRKYTSPMDIFNLIKIHNMMSLENNELYKIVETNIPYIQKYNLYTHMYITYM